MTAGADFDSLWDEFHNAVNMTSSELDDWLRTRAAAGGAEALPDQAGSPTGRKVLAILRKRKRDLVEQDAEVMREVVGTVRAQRGAELDPAAGERVWRYRLMDIGHDPLKPT